MLREFVHASSGTSAELEAITAERDFFREKYAEQMNEMEHLKGQVKESQRVIDKLRGQVLDLEIEKSSLAGQGRGMAKSPQRIASGEGSTDTSVTGVLSSDDDLTAKSEVENNAAPASGAAESSPSSAVDGNAASSNHSEEVDGGEIVQQADSHEEDDSSTDEQFGGGEEGEEPGDEDDEVNDIRANAARMLQWANYQTSKRVSQDEDGESETGTGSYRYNTPTKIGASPDAIVYSLPTSLDKRQFELDEESSLGSSSRQELSVRSWRSGANSINDRAGSGKIGKMFNSLKGMIDPPSESDGESNESSDGSYN